MAIAVYYNLGKSYSKYDSHSGKFGTARTTFYCRLWSGRRNTKKKKKMEKKKKTSNESIRAGCLIMALYSPQAFNCSRSSSLSLTSSSRFRRSSRFSRSRKLRNSGLVRYLRNVLKIVEMHSRGILRQSSAECFCPCCFLATLDALGELASSTELPAARDGDGGLLLEALSVGILWRDSFLQPMPASRSDDSDVEVTWLARIHIWSPSAKIEGLWANASEKWTPISSCWRWVFIFTSSSNRSYVFAEFRRRLSRDLFADSLFFLRFSLYLSSSFSPDSALCSFANVLLEATRTILEAVSDS